MSNLSDVATIVVSDTVEPGRMYLLPPDYSGTLAEHPEVARRLAEGSIVVASSPEEADWLQGIAEAVRQVVRIDLEAA